MSKPFTPSPQQEAIFADISGGRRPHHSGSAGGSSAKSTSIEMGLAYLPKNTSALVVAFNKPIADEMKIRVKAAQDAKKIPAGVAVSTLHSTDLDNSHTRSRSGRRSTRMGRRSARSLSLS